MSAPDNNMQVKATLQKRLRLNRDKVAKMITEEYDNIDEARYFTENMDIMCVTKLTSGDCHD